MRFEYYNDTGRTVSIHPATFKYGVNSNEKLIKPLEVRTFYLPDDTFPWVKMWDYADQGLQILVVAKEFGE